MRPRLCFLFLAGLLAFPPLTLESQPAPAKTRTYWPTHGWRRAASVAVGIDGRALEALHDSLEKEGILAMLLVRQGFLVESWYAPGYNEQSLFSLHSCTKSVISALVGPAGSCFRPSASNRSSGGGTLRVSPAEASDCG